MCHPERSRGTPDLFQCATLDPTKDKLSRLASDPFFRLALYRKGEDEGEGLFAARDSRAVQDSAFLIFVLIEGVDKRVVGEYLGDPILHSSIEHLLRVALAGHFNPMLALPGDVLVIGDRAVRTFDSHLHSNSGR